MAKDIIKARKLEHEIVALKAQNPQQEYKNTIIRAETVLRYHKGEGSQKQIAEWMGLKSKTSVRNWLDIYNESGIEGLKQMNNKPISKIKRDTSNDNKLLQDVIKDIKKLDADDPQNNEYPNTLKRVKAVELYLSKKETTLEAVAKKVGCEKTSVNKWVTVYQNSGIEGLKKIEGDPISKTIRDTSGDKELLDNLNKEIQKLQTEHPEKYPNTLKRATAISNYFSTDKTQRDVAADIGASQTMIKNWINIFSKKGIEGLKAMENQPLSKPIRDTSDDEKLKDKLIKGINKINAKAKYIKEYKNTLKRAEILLKYLNSNKSQADIGAETGCSASAIGNWLKILTENGMQGLSEIEDTPISKNKKGASQNKDKLITFIEELKADNTESNQILLKKANAILDYLNNEGNREEIAEKYKVNEKTFRNWLKAFKIEGVEGLMDKRKVNPKRKEMSKMAEPQPSKRAKKEIENTGNKRDNNSNLTEQPPKKRRGNKI